MNENILKHIGEKHGIYTIIDVLPQPDKYGHYQYKCICNECGYVKYTHHGSVAGPNHVITKCNHLRSDGNFKVKRKINNDRIDMIFTHMITRCYNKKSKSYRFYGEKGIKICDEWLLNPKSFEQWALQNGYSENLTIDRIDAKKDYAPDNCQWIPLEENARKAGKVNWITINGETLTGRQWSEKLGLGINRINTWIREYGEDITIELLKEMIKDPPINKCREPSQSWFEVYGIF